ncbi:UDP-N-acetylglucosamine--N-acetylmuramyl- (pentapeptide) pyrophosphoryl-undecaprenol N-acetylglucosamine transferase [Lunatimonas lonarensis]|uniref:UDP-N-acetylglucosamine--N-acetylmuramyl-(pentapeptide) pyrophosphoryl-undecaprenol N-acetylglucosamine transferase n=1 Tax=Lunatimonas lonarensis TaxID=1232681 RepID=R7ZRY6_9BACT|nr:undecaprenyldiphospho-muramoylpentapeptide beta-N-acetylglucosaminyltransferase [Lunatimonas lonarensis]EON76911.1 UDP-N-acetylglucosamine--N-acetylmuramyl- (pentapeptide) pyrophosphoryl-undecaprenol N-acetylglucosamine transferase [Lunatimonas lonarensis]
MSTGNRIYRIIISGGGTGGHIYPAIAIANAWMAAHPSSEILFVGAEGKMEMQKVPEAGYPIEGLTIAGLQRSLTLKNLNFPLKVWKSVKRSNEILKRFQPNLAVGVGGYASGPLLFAAQRQGIPSVIQEQNSYAGLTNKLLAKNAKAICVAYPAMERFFPGDRIHYTGNPVRSDILQLEGKAIKARDAFGLDGRRKTILVLGGSLGARTINEAVAASMAAWESNGYQVVWQTGRFYFNEMNERVDRSGLKHIHPMEFIREMDLAYSVADIVVSRAGALSVSELSLVGKPVIFIPSPNVAEDHQTKNAETCVSAGAAWMLKDREAISNLGEVLEKLANDTDECQRLGENLLKMGKPQAANEIVAVMEKWIQ